MEVKNRIIVVCDKDPIMLQRFCVVLERIGFSSNNLVCTNSIKDTIDFSKENDPDIIFVDMYVSEPGYSICSLVESAGIQLGIPVVLMSYPELSIGPLRGVAIRGRGFIPKPVQMLSLQSTMQTLLRERDLERSLSADYDTSWRAQLPANM